jgi:two-component sensor histidine kinase/PAS domain-containing protein
MNVFPIFPVFMASVCLTMAVYEFCVKVQMKGRKYSLAFAAACFGGFFYNIACAGIYAAPTAGTFLLWTRIQAVILCLSACCLLLYLAERTQVFSKAARYAFLGWFLAGAIVQALGLGDFTWISSSVRRIALPAPFGLDLGYMVVDPGIFSVVLRWSGVLFFAFVFLRIRPFVMVKGKDSRIVLIGVSLILLAYLNDTAVRFGLYRFLHFSESAWLIGIVITGVRRAGIFLRAAVAEEGLQASEEKFRSFLEDSSEAMVLTDEGGRILEFNRAAERMTGLGASAAIGTGIWNLMPLFSFGGPSYTMRSIEDWFRDYAFGLETPPASLTLDATISPEGGRTAYVRIDVFSIKTGGGVRFGGICHDVTELKEAERKLIASIEEKDVLLKEVHHRVKNNLQLISSLLYLQGFRLDDEKGKLVVRDCRDQVHSMALIHEDLYRSGDFGSVDFGNYLRILSSRLLATYGKASGAVISCESDDLRLGMDAAIPCGLVANELCINALRHAFPPGFEGDERSIRIRFLGSGDGTATLSVSDTGIGLPEGFDPGCQGYFGMKIVAKLAEQLGGRLSVEGGRGASFSVTFPLRGTKV